MKNLLNILLDVRSENKSQLEAHDQIIADIRNKLSPIQNLIALIENDASTEIIKQQLIQVKKSVKYLSNK